MPKILTKDCPILPDHLKGKRPGIPVPHLDDRDIDLALDHMLQRGALPDNIPTTKYGRRLAVEQYLKLEKGQPVDEVSLPWNTYKPTQPR